MLFKEENSSNNFKFWVEIIYDSSKIDFFPYLQNGFLPFYFYLWKLLEIKISFKRKTLKLNDQIIWIWLYLYLCCFDPYVFVGLPQVRKIIFYLFLSHHVFRSNGISQKCADSYIKIQRGKIRNKNDEIEVKNGW